MKIISLYTFLVCSIRDSASINLNLLQHLSLLLIILVLSSGNLSAQITDITRLSVQDMSAVYEESSPVVISDSEILIFFFTKNSTFGVRMIDSLYSSKSTDGGRTWQKKKFILEVTRTYYQEDYHLTTLKTTKGRILVAYNDVENDRVGLIYSDDRGATWSEPEFLDGNEFKLSQVFDKIIISWRYYYRVSYDDGKTWFQELSNFDFTECSFITLDGNTVLGFFLESEEGRGIYQKISTDRGQSWTEATIILPLSNFNVRYSVIKINSNELWIVYRNSYDTFSRFNICYIKSINGGVNWSNPYRFTSYAGIDDYVSGTCLINKPFITFSSTRFTNKPQISYALLGETIENFRPPFISNCWTNQDSIGHISWKINCRVTDDQTVSSVTAEPEFGSLFTLFDDGKHNDIDSADNIFGNILTLNYLPPSGNCVMDVNKIHLPLSNYGVLAEVYNTFNMKTIIKAEDNEQQQIIDEEILAMDYNMNLPQYDESWFLFSGGFILSGYTGSKMWTNAVAPALLVKDYLPGKIGTDFRNPINNIYVVRKEDSPFGHSWQQWKNAVSLGAEFYDGDNDGLYDPKDKNYNGTWEKNEDMPLLLGDETTWCIYNDGLPSEMRFWSSINPQGIEIKQTTFASNNPGLENTVFIRYSILNTGIKCVEMDSVYFGVWKDPDLGNAVHNYIGCDTSLNADFVYNKDFDQFYGVNSPSFFTTVLQGPIVQSFTEDTAYNNSGIVYGSSNLPGYKNLDISAHVFFIGGDPQVNEPDNPVSARYLLLGMYKSGNYPDPCDFPYGEVRGGINCNEINPAFWVSGDPVADTGWILKIQGDMRNLTGIGPFQLIKDKPQDIIIAYVLGRGTDPINSITVARENVRKAIQEYKSNFASMTYTAPPPVNPVNNYELYRNYPNPFNPVTTIRYGLPRDGFVTMEIFDILGQKVKTLLNKFQKADRYEVEFNGNGLASGIYIYRMKVNDFISSKKMVLVK